MIVNGKITSIKLCHSENGLYWVIKLVDNDGNEIGTFGTDMICDFVNFRNFSFGLLKICEKSDFFSLGKEEKKYPIMICSTPTKIVSIGNNNGCFLTIDENGKINNNKMPENYKYVDGYITSLESKSGVLASKVEFGGYTQYFNNQNAYLGFKPIYEYIDYSDEDDLKGAISFGKFIYQIMKLCNINELLPQNDTLVNYPSVSIIVDGNNCVRAIGNDSNDEYLVEYDGEYILVSNGEEILKKINSNRKI